MMQIYIFLSFFLQCYKYTTYRPCQLFRDSKLIGHPIVNNMYISQNKMYLATWLRLRNGEEKHANKSVETICMGYSLRHKELLVITLVAICHLIHLIIFNYFYLYRLIMFLIS